MAKKRTGDSAKQNSKPDALGSGGAGGEGEVGRRKKEEEIVQPPYGETGEKEAKMERGKR